MNGSRQDVDLALNATLKQVEGICCYWNGMLPFLIECLSWCYCNAKVIPKAHAGMGS